MSTRLCLLCTLLMPFIVTACQARIIERTVIVTATPNIDATATFAAAKAATEAVPSETPTMTPTPDPFPTPVIGAIYLAEQRFEGGWMFWLQPNQQIWLLTIDNDDEHVWSVYDDTYIEGDAEYDPDLVPPEGRLQPVRGFGNLWRENLEVRDAVGWALEDERGHTTRYEYHHGGQVSDDSEYITGPGYHLVQSFYGDTFRFNEADSSWEILE